MLQSLRKGIDTAGVLVPGQKVVAGVSGGADSLALAHGLIGEGFDVIISHLNHGIRPEADQDAKIVELFAQSCSAKFVSGTVKTPNQARKNRQSLEEAARELRYGFLFRAAEAENAAAVVVGHTADDQVETILMHLLRGAGTEGLGGMALKTMTKWSSSIPLLRPLLYTWRREVAAYCEDSGLDPLTDSSNLDTSFRRNKIRHELIPYLEEYNPNLKEIVQRTGEVLRGDLAVLDSVVKEVAGRVIQDIGRDHVTLDLKKFSELHVGLKRRILRTAIFKLRPNIRDLGFDLIQRVIEELGSLPKGSKIDLFQGLCLRIEEDNFNIESWEYFPDKTRAPQLKVDRIEIHDEGEFDLGDGWEVAVERVEASPGLVKKIEKNTDRFLVYINLQEVSFPLAVRVRSPGDRIKPGGMGGHSQKISDFMINKGVPRHLRGRWPLLESKKKVIWVPGYQISEEVKLGENSGEILKIQITKTK